MLRHMLKPTILPIMALFLALPAIPTAAHAQEVLERGTFQIRRGAVVIGEERFSLTLIRSRGANTLRLESNAFFPPRGTDAVITTTVDFRPDSSPSSSDVRRSTRGVTRTLIRYGADLVTTRIVRADGSETARERPFEGPAVAFHDSLASTYLFLRSTPRPRSLVHLESGAIRPGALTHVGASRLPGTEPARQADRWTLTTGGRTIDVWFGENGRLETVSAADGSWTARRTE